MAAGKPSARGKARPAARGSEARALPKSAKKTATRVEKQKLVPAVEASPPVRTCAACGRGESESRPLIARKAQQTGSRFAICEECLRELARSLRSRAEVVRTPGARSSLHPPANLVPAPGEICGWQKFRLDGKKLEWRAERIVLQAARPAVLVHVRRPESDRQITLTMHAGSVPTKDDAERAGQWLLSPPAEDPELSGGPEAYGPLGSLVAWQSITVEGQALEWSAERSYVYEATPYVQVDVREYHSSNRFTTYLDFRTEPTLDHAVAAAREL